MTDTLSGGLEHAHTQYPHRSNTSVDLSDPLLSALASDNEEVPGTQLIPIIG